MRRSVFINNPDKFIQNYLYFFFCQQKIRQLPAGIDKKKHKLFFRSGQLLLQAGFLQTVGFPGKSFDFIAVNRFFEMFTAYCHASL